MAFFTVKMGFFTFGWNVPAFPLLSALWHECLCKDALIQPHSLMVTGHNSLILAKGPRGTSQQKMSEEHLLEKQDLGNWWVLTELSWYLDETCLVLLVISIIFLEAIIFGAWLSLCSSQTNYNPKPWSRGAERHSIYGALFLIFYSLRESISFAWKSSQILPEFESDGCLYNCMDP